MYLLKVKTVSTCRRTSGIEFEQRLRADHEPGML